MPGNRRAFSSCVVPNRAWGTDLPRSPGNGYNRSLWPSAYSERRTSLEKERLSNRTYYLALLAIVAVALALRLFRFGQLPPGLYHDEAYNGLDALRVLQGWHPLWFPANNGREPLFMYLMAVSIGLLGRTAAAVRAPALVLGLLTVPATAFMATGLFNRRIGLLAAAVTAITFWAVHLSRMGFRAVALPLFTALALGSLWRGLRSGRRRDYALGGLCYGLSFYTYLAARATPAALLVLAGLMLLPAARLPKPEWRKLALFALVAAITVAPLAGYMAIHPEAWSGRADQVLVLNPAVSHGNPLGALARNTLHGLELFVVRGDHSPRHNLPNRPIFDPLLGAAFLLGVVIAFRRRGEGWFVLVWVATLLAPDILAEDGYHFLRSVGIQPLVFVLPALGLDAAWQWLAARGRALLGAAIAGLILLGGLTSTTYDYFWRYAHNQQVYYQFEGGVREMADRINQFLATAPAGTVRRVSIPQGYWDIHASLAYLIPAGPQVYLAAEGAPAWPAGATEAMVFFWPGVPADQILAALPPHSDLTVSDDLLEQRDLEPAVHPVATIVQVRPNQAAGQPLAAFAGGINLDAAQVEEVSPQHWQVHLSWEAKQPVSVDYTVFVHVERGSTVLGQHDGTPAGGFLPTTLWRPGDRIEDVHELTLSAPYDPQTDRLVVGLYDLRTMARLPVAATSLPASNDAVAVPVSH